MIHAHARISTKKFWSSRLDHVEDEHSQACFFFEVVSSSVDCSTQRLSARKAFWFWEREIEEDNPAVSSGDCRGCYPCEASSSKRLHPNLHQVFALCEDSDCCERE
jgi:hypothetical protein